MEEVSLLPDAPAGHSLGPLDQALLGLCCGEPGELHHLVDPQLPRGERLGDQGKPFQRVGSLDPPQSLPVRDAVAHADPVRHVSGARVLPRLQAVNFGNEPQKLPLGKGDTAMAGVGRLDQFRGIAVLLCVHPRPHLVTGGDFVPVYTNTRSIVKEIGRNDLYRRESHCRTTQTGTGRSTASSLSLSGSTGAPASIRGMQRCTSSPRPMPTAARTRPSLT